MGLENPLLLTILDKLLVGILLLVAGWWLNGRLEKLKGQIALHTALAQARAAALGSLWSLTQHLTPRSALPSASDCSAAFTELRQWYYSQSGAMHLSFDATGRFFRLLQALEQAEPDCAKAKQLTSELRTQLKLDMGVYTSREARAQLPGVG